MQHNTTRELSPVEIEAYKQRLIEEAEESRRARLQDRRRMETLFDGFRDCEPVDEELGKS
jgi:hypothetical protein